MTYGSDENYSPSLSCASDEVMTVSDIHFHTTNSNSVALTIKNGENGNYIYAKGDYAALMDSDFDDAVPLKCFESSQVIVADSRHLDLEFECYAFTGCAYTFRATFKCSKLETDGVQVSHSYLLSLCSIFPTLSI